MPPRTSSWSSAMATVITEPPLPRAARTVPAPAVGVWRTADASAARVDPFPHPAQAVPLAGRRRRRRRRGTVVNDDLAALATAPDSQLSRCSGACLRMLVKASWTTRYIANRTSGSLVRDQLFLRATGGPCMRRIT
jgi:hypothetical protein